MKDFHSAILIYCFLFIPSAANLIAQQHFVNVAGILFEAKSGEVLTGFHVLAYRDSVTNPTGFLRGTATNRFGFFTFGSLPVGHYVLRYSGVGFETLFDTLTLAGNEETVWRRVGLSSTDIRLQQITVEARRFGERPTEISAVVVNPSLVTQLPAIGGETDLFRSLQLLPSVRSVSEVSSGLHIRGGSPAQNLNLLDGVAIYNPYHLGGFLSAFNTEALKDVRLHKGMFPAEYGGRLSSVLDMTLKDGTGEKISGAGGISLINARFTLEGPVNEDMTFMISGRRIYLDLLLGLFLPLREVPEYYFYDLNGKLTWKLSDSDHLRFSGHFGRDVFNQPEEVESNFDLRWGNTAWNIRWTHIFSPRWFMNVSAILTDYSFLMDIGAGLITDNAFKSESRIRDATARFDLQYLLSDRHCFRFGGDLTSHTVTSSAVDLLGVLREEGPLNAAPLSTPEAALYLQDEWKLNKEVTVDLGGRITYFGSGGHLRIDPRIALSYRLTDNLTAFGGYSRMHQFLSVVQRYDISLPTDVWVSSSQKLRPGKSDQIVAGGTYSLDDGYELSVETFYKTMWNLIEYRENPELRPDVSLESQLTPGRGVAYGVEVLLQKRFGEITGWAGYSLSWSRRRFAEINNGEWFPSTDDRRHVMSLAMTYRLGESWEFGGTWIFGTGQPMTMPSGQYYFDDDYRGSGLRFDFDHRNTYRLPVYHRLDIALQHKFTWFDVPFRLSINLYNVYNRKNPFFQYVSPNFTRFGESARPVVHQFTVFPLIPTLGLSFTF